MSGRRTPRNEINTGSTAPSPEFAHLTHKRATLDRFAFKQGPWNLSSQWMQCTGHGLSVGRATGSVDSELSRNSRVSSVLHVREAFRTSDTPYGFPTVWEGGTRSINSRVFSHARRLSSAWIMARTRVTLRCGCTEHNERRATSQTTRSKLSDSRRASPRVAIAVTSHANNVVP
jgi:hypothetical protein